MPAEKLPQEKTCTRCGEMKPLEEFYRRSRSKDGKDSWCKSCVVQAVMERERADPEGKTERARRYRERHPDRIRARKQRWQEENPRAAVESTRRYQKRYPEKHRARQVLQDAVKSRRVVKPTACERCGEQFEKRKLHGHHGDYSKPLEVEWLCHTCHVETHRREDN